MAATMHRGTTVLREWISTYLQAKLAIYVPQARIDWALPAHLLPTPQTYDMYDMEIVATNKYPGIGADFHTETGYERNSFSDRAEQEYAANYAGGVYVWAATPRDPAGDVLVLPYRESAMKVRDDLTELVKQALLVTPSLGHPDECWLDESSVNVNKLDPMKAGSNRPDWVCGAIISVVYRVRSELWIPPYGSADTFDVAVQLLED